VSFQALKVLAEAAGLGGIAVGLTLYLYRDVIRSKFLRQLNQKQSFIILLVMITLAWSIAIAGIVSYVVLSRSEKEKVAYIDERVDEVLDFSGWKAVPLNDTNKISPVIRTRSLRMALNRPTQEDHLDRHTTTGIGLDFSAETPNVSFTELPRVPGRSEIEGIVRVSRGSFERQVATARYRLTYWNSYRTKRDGWFAKDFVHQTDKYSFTIRFPAALRPWTEVKVFFRAPDAAEFTLLKYLKNSGNSHQCEWESPPGFEFLSGSRITVEFVWPELT
jgi:hypothetical protein